MSEVREGFYWHVHHDVLLEWCYDEQRRWDYIKQSKPPEEIWLRLYLFRPVRGSLPNEVIEACQDYRRSERVGIRAYEEYDAGRRADKRKFSRALGDWYVAWQEFRLVLRTYAPQIEALHRQECPDCPWDGTTIFPEE